MKIILAGTSVLALLMAVDASSAVYKWEDDRGVTGFAEDFGKVPEKYRKRAKLSGQDPVSDVGAPITEDNREKNSVKGTDAEVKDVRDEAVPQKTKNKQLFGGKEESYWLNEFGKLKADLRSYKEQLDAINARISNTAQISRSDYKSLDLSRKLLEEQEGAARKRLESITAEADRAGVPQDLR